MSRFVAGVVIGAKLFGRFFNYLGHYSYLLLNYYFLNVHINNKVILFERYWEKYIFINIIQFM